MMTTNTITQSATGDATPSIAGIGKKGKATKQSLFSKLLAQLSHKPGQASKLAAQQQKATSVAAEQSGSQMATLTKGANGKTASKAGNHHSKIEMDASPKLTTKAETHLVKSDVDSSDAIATSMEGHSTSILLVQGKHTNTSASAALTTTSVPISKTASSKSSKLEVGADAGEKVSTGQATGNKSGLLGSEANIGSTKVNTKEVGADAGEKVSTGEATRNKSGLLGSVANIGSTKVNTKEVGVKLESVQAEPEATTLQLSQDSKGTSAKTVGLQAQSPQVSLDKVAHQTIGEQPNPQAQVVANQDAQALDALTKQTEKSAHKNNPMINEQSQPLTASQMPETQKLIAKSNNKVVGADVAEQTGVEHVRSEGSKAQQALAGALQQRNNATEPNQPAAAQIASPLVTTRIPDAGNSSMQQDFASNQDEAELSWLDAGKVDNKISKTNDFQAHMAYRSQKAFSANEAMLEIVRSAKDGSTTLELQLEPAHLGKVQITIQMDAAKQIQVAISMDQAASRQALEQHLPQLRSMLAQQGLDLGSFSMQMNQQQHQEQPARGFAHGHANTSSESALLNNVSQTTTRTGVNLASDGHLSIMA